MTPSREEQIKNFEKILNQACETKTAVFIRTSQPKIIQLDSRSTNPTVGENYEGSFLPKEAVIKGKLWNGEITPPNESKPKWVDIWIDQIISIE